MLTSAPSVLTTVTVHVLHVQTRLVPSVVHAIILTPEMAELAISYTVSY